MKLKIKIKEVKEEARKLTIEERCLVTVSRLPGGCSERYRAEASAKLDSIGFVSNQGSQGKFRTETIRDATPGEYRAWTYLQLVKHCACPERKISSLDCNDCFLSGVCVASDFKTKIAIYILNGKEVILELVDE